MKGNMKMAIRRLAAPAAIAGAIALIFAGLQGAAAHEEKMGPTSLLKTQLEGMPGKEANVVLFNVGPGWKIGRHYHPGHVFVYVLSGSIKISVEGQPPRTMGAGEVLHEVPGRNMTANNISSSKGAKFLVFQVGDEGKPLTVSTK